MQGEWEPRGLWELGGLRGLEGARGAWGLWGLGAFMTLVAQGFQRLGGLGG